MKKQGANFLGRTKGLITKKMPNFLPPADTEGAGKVKRFAETLFYYYKKIKTFVFLNLTFLLCLSSLILNEEQYF